MVFHLRRSAVIMGGVILFVGGLFGFRLARRVFPFRSPDPRVAAGGMAVRDGEKLPPADPLATFRLARDTELSRQYERLRELIAAGETTATIREAAEEALWRLTKIEAAEHEAETVLALQGWPGAKVTILGNEAMVVVPREITGPAEAAQIGRLVATAAGIPEAAVRILARAAGD